MANRLKLTPQKIERFLEALRQSANVSHACQSIGVSRRAAYDRRNQDAIFAAAWDGAVQEAVDELEAEARRRALEGTTRPVFYKGEECGGIQEYSDVLLIFLLKHLRPEVYNPLAHLAVRTVAEMSERMDALEARAQSKGARMVEE